jgi:predicted component of type VI protein secretion system
MPTLHVTLPDGSDIVHELTEDVVTIGRVPDNMLQIDDASVSSHHATLTLTSGQYVLRDTGSTNGTRLNGKELAPDTDHKLSGGEKITFGKVATRYASDAVSGEALPLPEEEDTALVPAAASVRPVDFANASPFQTKKKKKDPIGMAIIVFSIVAILAFAGAMLQVFSLKSPL